MKVTELRIGNLVHAFKTWYPIDGTDFEVEKISTYTPIPLTEEWLVNFGFERQERTDNEKGFVLLHKEKSKSVYIRTFCEPNISGFFNMFNFSECHEDKIQFIRKIEYIHQLQNIYFALTGEELILK